MEESINSSMESSVFSMAGSAFSEESGWTMYFEEFMASEEKQVFTSSFVSGSCSMVSDAASCVAWKSSANVAASKEHRELSLKKRKGRGLLDDDSLQDTASSPVNSPKVAKLSYLTINPSKRDGYRDIAQEDDVGCRNDQELEEIVGEFGLVERTNECAELKNRGLCLVPLSMLVDYLE
ncbi:hypothetical protein Cni_G00563 [Canna indica]|uniref:Uncharacterized protein n=1 Tax=Canna indica TaxID=4628 RepID=A0AAQ3JLK0_9LILI|nr:hypothetical protein Cni_G00563 [Canna indica]